MRISKYILIAVLCVLLLHILHFVFVVSAMFLGMRVAHKQLLDSRQEVVVDIQEVIQYIRKNGVAPLKTNLSEADPFQQIRGVLFRVLRWLQERPVSGCFP